MSVGGSKDVAWVCCFLRRGWRWREVQRWAEMERKERAVHLGVENMSSETAPAAPGPCACARVCERRQGLTGTCSLTLVRHFIVTAYTT